MPYGTVNADVIQSSVANTSLGAGNASIMKNRIINGAMVIDQRNAGASVSLSSGGAYAVDRWNTYEDTDATVSIQQVSDAPAGFVNSLKVTVTTADSSVGATQFCLTRQFIEGYNVADLNWGTADAKTITLSFWAKSSLTGTFGGVLHNSAHNRSYPFTYTISSANTWEQKSITVAGDTSGTWLTTNGVGMGVEFGLGVGSTYSGTAGSWAAATYFSATGATNVVSTLNATWQITGVQLEVGSSATGYEYRQYQQELALCQRYLPAFTAGVGSGNGPVANLSWVSATSIQAYFTFKTTPRVAPTGIAVTSVGNFLANYPGNANPALTGLSFQSATTDMGFLTGTTSGGASTAGLSGILLYSGTSQVLFTGCEL